MSKLTELKGEVVTLRNKIESNRATLQDVLDLNRKRKLVEKMQRFFIKTSMWLLVSAVILVSGCQTVKGIAGDSGWILTKMSDNIQTQEK